MPVSGVGSSTYTAIVSHTNTILRMGSRGSAVEDLQKALKEAGFNPGSADGIFGPKTLAAVKDFQRAHGLVVDGVVGPKTWGALASTASAPPPATTSPSTPSTVPTLPTATLRRGSRGADVRELQSALNQLGFSAGKVDGDFGPKTLAAVKSFQRAHGLAVDGIVGPKTWAAMGAALAGNADTIDANPVEPPAPSPTPGGSGVPPTEATFDPPNVTLRAGSKGPHVKTLQRALISAGFNCGAVDGDFGPKTLAAVKAFQAARGLAVDGIVGVQTWTALAGKAPEPVAPGSVEWRPDGEYTRTAEHFVMAALAQTGDAYVYGAETNLDDVDPDVFDCSELVQWAAAQVGLDIGDGARYQYPRCQDIPVSQAINTRGALLFRRNSEGKIVHVAISLGNGQTIEAKGRAYGVGVFSAYNGYDCAGLIPGMIF